ncbi:hypothetical protein COV42_00280 [Candidatus Campbellbacteria bacterium CG11_big_fil_rev_8_21_14_0_20_44_21]|uniref:HTH HARE-type domain-containing protein n=1 Tax=Candidatus Campbellbacteria bacterium CG22_combo_CG10-13_8_21_14_all_43_18 TaxID=1974530 RepID=A0A2H0DWP7_9BACT|nr:MAG: hypothetical protein COW82_01110 [Candidatus Campbellbacteria bacterium CG22_combo_CG10-13_8_21_14_all_43_18]PIR24514.1 MAG: hypothetical protein COV42_00280 [Candidatus Campbellbacteria bacterium CG11_big_fil_rev_8_21_14_0_20_44_21]
MTIITFKPKQATKHLTSVLPERARSVLESRFGLGRNKDRLTLEAIGAIYGITRERVRQIENHALNAILKSDAYSKESHVFDELEELIDSLGGIVSEEDLLSAVSSNPETRNHIHFILVLGDSFKKEKEDFEFKHRWFVDRILAEKVHDSIRKIYKDLSDSDLVSEQDIVSSFLGHLQDVSEKYKKDEIVRRWLSLSKQIAKNPLGEWGLSSSPNVCLKGMKDYAYLVIRQHGSPLHFSEVAKKIKKMFGKEAHIATCHNELIKDSRFVLVGRGLYALKEWGYSAGVVKDVIVDILEKHGSLTKDEIIELVLKERYVKPNTVVVNLQDNNTFKKDKKGRYSLNQ